ncbi:DUF3899 domain-containing protein [Staphylococcus caeli]|uniref:Membrane protein n=1 Tax=Staphylococcus caeli TaxID=2201815 RepID=A0A1D4IWR3_9STAP|nr:DUF3899 domain-containing protein [Staphylococcus caeli]SCS53777.1 membrane protein [Staphylococcus caeli]SCS89438.1 membrane protein [Staphylococcus caeli]
MKKTIHVLLWFVFTPLLTLIFWLFTTHTLVQYINIIFYIAITLTILSFIILIVQEGVLDPTSYGFRRLKYQLTNKKHKDALENDEFFKPTQVKKTHYFVSTWVVTAFYTNIFYVLLSIVISFLI